MWNTRYIALKLLQVVLQTIYTIALVVNYLSLLSMIVLGVATQRLKYKLQTSGQKSQKTTSTALTKYGLYYEETDQIEWMKILRKAKDEQRRAEQAIRTKTKRHTSRAIWRNVRIEGARRKGKQIRQQINRSKSRSSNTTSNKQTERA